MPVASAVVPRLWPHQVEAVAAVSQAVGRGGRASLHMACGTGKTRIGGAVAAELAGTRRVLVVVPTIELLAQTLHVYRMSAEVPLGAVVAVCSDPMIAELELLSGEADVVVTTAADALADSVSGRRRATVLSTYASLPVIADAHANHSLDQWDLVVVDEAHRTTGNAAGPWKAVHHDAQIPTRRRLYMTATPRVTQGSADDVVSMDDTRVYGEVAYRLPFSRAIDMGLLANYRVVVAVVTDKQVHRLARDEGLIMRLGASSVAPATLAGQIATLRTMTEYGVRRAISYHHRVVDAAAWARTLPAAASLLPGGPATLWAGHISGAQPPHLRRRILERLADPGEETVVVSNARVLNEGIDVPVVDAVVFSRPRESAIDTIQALGRALRTGGRRDKVATIVVPLLLAEQDSAEAALEGSEWEPVWKVLRALRDHDDRLDDALRVMRTRLGEGRLFDPDSREVKLPPWLRVEGVEVPDAFAAAITIRAVREATPSWEEYYGAAREFRRVQGHLEVPYDWVTGDGLRLGSWFSRQRTGYNRGDLTEERVALLEELGIVWDQLDEQWNRTFDEVRSIVEGGGDLLDVSEDHVTASGVVLVNWFSAQRARRKQSKLSGQRIALLDRIGFPWDGVEARWRHRYDQVKALYDQRGSLLRLPSRSREAIWLEGQKAAYRNGALADWQVRALTDIGLGLEADRRDLAWRNTYEELKAFHAETGLWSIPKDLTTVDGIRLTSWATAQRSAKRQGTLRAEYEILLDRIGFPWEMAAETRTTRWTTRYGELHRWLRVEGHLNVPRGPLRSWLYQQRKKHRAGTLPADQAALLTNLDPLWHDEQAQLTSDRVRAFFRLTDKSWTTIAALLPEPHGRSRTWAGIDHRAVVEAVLWKVRTGARWDDVPTQLGPPQTVYGWWKQWYDDGLWSEIERHAEVRGRRAQP